MLWFPNLHSHRHLATGWEAHVFRSRPIFFFFFFHGKNSTRCWKPSRGEDSAFAFWRASLSTCRFVSGIFALRIIWKTCTSIKGVAHCECLWINVAEIVSRRSVTCWKYALHTKQTVAMKRCLLSTKVEVNTFTMPLSLRHLSLDTRKDRPTLSFCLPQSLFLPTASSHTNLGFIRTTFPRYFLTVTPAPIPHGLIVSG